MWEFFIKNNRFSILLILALLGFGLYSVLVIPKESAPEVQVPVGIVSTALPGAPAADVETLVTNEIERGLAGTLENVKKITSSSREGVSVVTVEFDASADIDDSIQSLKDEVDTISPELPEDAEDPFVTEVDFVDQPILTIAVSGELTDAEFTAIADKFEVEIENLQGISKVEADGVRNREVSVIVDQSALNNFNLSITDVVNGIRSANNTFPIGQIINNGIIYNVAFEGDIGDTSEVKNIPISTRGGQPIFVRDIATIEDGLSSPNTFSRLSVDGEPSLDSISFNIFKQRGGDITAIAASVHEKIAELQKPNELLGGLTVYTVLDSGEEIETDLINLTMSGFQTILLVVIALIIAIGWREGLVAGTAIPLSFVIGFIGLYLSGNTINFISLFALILGIGVLVDSGIVMVEGINKKMKENPSGDKTEAAIATIKEFSSPLTSGTLTTVSMFVGLFIVSGVTGQFIAGIPFTLVFVLFASLLVALGFLPLIASLFLKRRNSTKLEQKQVEYARRLENKYTKVLESTLGNKFKERVFIALILFGFVSSIALIPFGFVRVVFFEQSDVEWVVVEVEMPEGTVKESTDIAARRVEEILYDENLIEAFSTTVGSGSVFGNGGSGEKLANIFITLRPDREITSTDFITELRAKTDTLRDINVTVEQPSNGPPTGSPIGVKFSGDNLAELTQFANQSAEILKTIDGVTNVRTSTNNNNTEFVLTLDKAKTAAAGLDPQSVSLTLRSAVFGTDATTLTTLDEDIDVVVKLNLTSGDAVAAADTNITTIETLENITFPTPQGDTVLLSSLADVSLQESSNVISHEDQKRIITMEADLGAGGNVIQVNNEFLSRIDEELNIPSSIEVSLGGETEESNQAFKEMFLALIVGIILMIAVLVLQFNSFRYTLYVLSILPFSLIGILYGLALTGNPLSFPSLMGFIALTGIIVNNSILLIDRTNQVRLTEPDLPVKSAVIKAASSRLRPILLTTLTTVLGMVPLLTVDPIWVPLAFAIMFGLSFSVVITLLLIPIIYSKWPGNVRK